MEKKIKLFLEFLQKDKKLSNNTLQSYKRDITQYESYINEEDIKKFHLPRWDEIPNIDLYIDQVVSLLETYLSTYIKGENNGYCDQRFFRSIYFCNDRLFISRIDLGRDGYSCSKELYG